MRGRGVRRDGPVCEDRRLLLSQVHVEAGIPQVGNGTRGWGVLQGYLQHLTARHLCNTALCCSQTAERDPAMHTCPAVSVGEPLEFCDQTGMDKGTLVGGIGESSLSPALVPPQPAVQAGVQAFCKLLTG